MRSDHPLANQLQVEYEDLARYPLLTQSGPLPRGADIDAHFTAFKAELGARVTSNSIQMLRLCILLNMGVALFTRLGFLHEIETGQIAWRPINSPAINSLKIGMILPANRDLSPPAAQFARQLSDDLHHLVAT